MDQIYSGGCACGAVRYTVGGAPVAMLDCQCRQCQRESGTGHASHLAFVDAEVEVSGAATLWDAVGDSGAVKRRAFCPVCGSPVYMTFPDRAEVFVVRAASLDDPSLYQPQFVTYAEAGYSWDHLDPAITKFDRLAS